MAATYDNRPLVWLQLAHDEIDFTEINDNVEGGIGTLDECIAFDMEAVLEGMIEVDVDDQYMTRQEGDDLFVACVEILRADRDTEWSNPA